MNHYLLLLICLPLAGAVAVRSLPTRLASVTARSVVLAGCAACLPLWFWYRPTNPDLQLLERVSIIPRFGVDYSLGLDGIGLIFVFLVSIVCLVATWLPASDSSDRQKSHVGWLLAHYGALLGAFLAVDAFSFALSCTAALVTVWWLAGRELRDMAPAAVLMLTAAFLEVGVFGVLRFGPLVPNPLPVIVHQGPILALGIAVALAARGAFHSQWVRMIAYLSMAQAAMAIAALLTGTPVGISGGVQLAIVQSLLVTATIALVCLRSRHTRFSVRLTDLRVAWSPLLVLLLFASTVAIGLPTLQAARRESASTPVAWNAIAFAAAAAGVWLLALAGRRAIVTPARPPSAPLAASAPSSTLAPASRVSLASGAVALVLVGLASWTLWNPPTVQTLLRVPALKLAARGDSRYQTEFLAACDTTVTPDMKAASPAAQFLAAAPCGPDGKPIENPAVAPSTPAAAVR